MKTKYYTIRNIEEALEEVAYDEEHIATGEQFLTALKQTKPGERENVVIATVEPE